MSEDDDCEEKIVDHDLKDHACDDEEFLEEDMNYLINITENVLNLCDYTENNFNISASSSYATVNSEKGRMVVRKFSIIWLLTKTNNKLSSSAILTKLINIVRTLT